MPLPRRALVWSVAAAVSAPACAESPHVDEPLSSPGDDSGGETAELEPPGDTTTGTWELGEPAPCADPVDEVSWADHSDRLWGGEGTLPGQSAGCVALVDDGDDWLIAATVSGGDVSWLRLGEGQGGTEDITPGAVRLRVEDLDQDGEADALVFARSLQVGWSFATEDATWEVLIDDDDGCDVGEVGIGDVDGDGDLDLVVPDLDRCGDGTRHRALWSYVGDRRYEPVEGGLEVAEGFWGMAFDVLTIDIDDDGDLDQYWCNDLGNELAPNGWLHNEQGVLVEAADLGADIAAHCMGVSVGDLDGDGRWDLYVGANREHMLLLGADDGWVDHTHALGMPGFGSEQMAWGSAFVDVDNDGLQDLLVATSDFAGSDYLPYPLWLIRQTEDGHEEIGLEEIGAARGLPQEAAPRGLVAAELNGDGVVDLVVADAMRPPWLLLSEGCTAAHWVEVAAPRGSLVTVWAGDRFWRAQAASDPGFGASQPPVAHIGLGDVETIDHIVVDVPYLGRAELVGPIDVDRRVELVALD